MFKITDPGGANVIEEIIDSGGDGLGHTLNGARSVALDRKGNVYVTGDNSDNAFRIARGGEITEIIDASGDGQGNPLLNAAGVAVDTWGNVFVTGAFSWNAFRIEARSPSQPQAWPNPQ